MKIKNKGKVYPSPSSSSVAADSVLKLLPAAILALASFLSFQDREVLAYMIAWSLKTTTNPYSPGQYPKKRSSKKSPNSSNTNHNSNLGNHKAPSFDCDCFDCYTSYWFRWDSSPNRELIHQVIEAFEEHLATDEKPRKNATRGKKREKTSRRTSEKPVFDVPAQPEMPLSETPPAETDESSSVADFSPDDDVSPAITPVQAADGEQEEDAAMVHEVLAELVPIDVPETEETATVVGTQAAATCHKGLARKVLPDVLGLLNSRLWSLWSPNV